MCSIFCIQMCINSLFQTNLLVALLGFNLLYVNVSCHLTLRHGLCGQHFCLQKLWSLFEEKNFLYR